MLKRGMNKQVIETDVLCIGGGVAGLMAAIRASDLGARVVVAEKANTLRSGDAGMGNDHFPSYIPEVHGPDVEPFVQELANSPVFGRLMRSARFWRTRLEKSFELVKLWDSWGISMKYQGKYEFAGHTLPGREAHCSALKYYGQNQKQILTKKAREKGVKILNRIMVFDLLRQGSVIGATGIHTRDDRMVEFRAKSVILGTGRCMRLFPGPTPQWMFNLSNCPGTTGDGRAMAYRAGAELVNMELLIKWAGPKYFSRCGKGSWVGVIRDSKGKPLGPFLTKPNRRYGDPISDIYSTLFADYARTGKGPVYMSCKGISDEDLEYQNLWLTQEGNTALLNHLKEEAIDVRKNDVEFMTYEVDAWGGIPYNEKGETSLKGLYAAGDEYGDQISAAAIFGWISGENAARYVQQKKPAIDDAKLKAAVKSKSDFLDSIRSREDGITWQEANIALQQLMQDYAGGAKSEDLLKAGLSHLRKLKKKAHDNIMAKNQHELMRCLEVLNLFDLGELVLLAAIERKETRGNHIRPDYPFTNPLLNKMLICRRKGNNPVFEWREIEG
jgi:succinate dehydrogenase/fumarate reductase flavoprotein subunit